MELLCWDFSISLSHLIISVIQIIKIIDWDIILIQESV